MNLKQIVSCIEMIFCIIIYLIKGTLQDKALRIIGGRDAAPGEFPYVVKMEAKVERKDGFVHYSHICTCTLLKPTWSLTAGHCIKALLNLLSLGPSIKGIIKYNISYNHKPPYSHILSTFLHPNINVPDNPLLGFYNDVGLLLSEEVSVSIFGKLSSVDYLTLYGTKVLTLGFGITKAVDGSYGDAYSVNKPLQVLDVIITRCFETGGNPTFCLGGLCGKWSAVCPGDSGGPVLHASGVVGVNTATHVKICNEKLALSPSFKLRSFSGVITPASPYIDWVTNVIK